MKKPNRKGAGGNAGWGAVYGLGVAGAAVYYIQHATAFGMDLVGAVKAIFRPAFLIYKPLKVLKF